MFKINFEHGVCTSAPFDETIFYGLDNTIVHVISDNTDYELTCVEVCSYVSKDIGKVVYPCGTHYYHEGIDGIELELCIQFH